jgi:hypothetical protein
MITEDEETSELETLVPPSWDEVEADEEYKALSPLKKQMALGNWVTAVHKYAKTSGEYDDDPQAGEAVQSFFKSKYDELNKDLDLAVETGQYEDNLWGGAKRVKDRFLLGFNKVLPSSSLFGNRTAELAVEYVPKMMTGLMDLTSINKLSPNPEVREKGFTQSYLDASKPVREYFRGVADYAQSELDDVSAAGRALGGGFVGEMAEEVPKAAAEALQEATMALATGGATVTTSLGKPLASAMAGLNVSSVMSGLRSMVGTIDAAEADYREKDPSLTREEARLKALPEALTSGASTALVTRLGGFTGIESVLLKGGPKSLRGKVLEVLKEAGSEGLEEATDQSLQDLSERFYRNPEKAWADTYKELAMAYSLGAVLGGGFSAASQTLNSAADKAKDGGAPQTAAALRERAEKEAAIRTTQLFGDSESSAEADTLADELLGEMEGDDEVDGPPNEEVQNAYDEKPKQKFTSINEGVISQDTTNAAAAAETPANVTTPEPTVTTPSPTPVAETATLPVEQVVTPPVETATPTPVAETATLPVEQVVTPPVEAAAPPAVTEIPPQQTTPQNTEGGDLNGLRNQEEEQGRTEALNADLGAGAEGNVAAPLPAEAPAPLPETPIAKLQKKRAESNPEEFEDLDPETLLSDLPATEAVDLLRQVGSTYEAPAVEGDETFADYVERTGVSVYDFDTRPTVLNEKEQRYVQQGKDPFEGLKDLAAGRAKPEDFSPAVQAVSQDTPEEAERQRKAKETEEFYAKVGQESEQNETNAAGKPVTAEQIVKAPVELKGVKGAVSGRSLPVRQVITDEVDDRGVSITKVVPGFVNDANTMAEVLSQDKGVNRVYVPKEDVANLDPEDIFIKYDENGNPYVVAARHKNYGVVYSDTGLTQNGESLADLHEPTRQKNSQAQIQGKKAAKLAKQAGVSVDEVAIPEMTDKFTKRVSNAPVSKEETEKPEAVAKTLKAIQDKAMALSGEAVTTNDGNVVNIDAELADRIGIAATNLYLARLRGVDRKGKFKDASGVVADIKKKVLAKLKKRPGTRSGVSLDQKVGDGSSTVGDLMGPTGQNLDNMGYADVPLDTQVSQNADAPTQGPTTATNNAPAGEPELNSYDSVAAKAMSEAEKELGDLDLKNGTKNLALWKETLAMLNGGKKRKDLTPTRAKIVKEMDARMRERMRDLISQQVVDVDTKNAKSVLSAESKADMSPKERGVLVKSNLNQIIDWNGGATQEKFDIKRVLLGIAGDPKQPELVRIFAKFVGSSNVDFSGVQFEALTSLQKEKPWAGLYTSGDSSRTGKIQVNVGSFHRGSIGQTIVHEALHHVAFHKLRPSYNRTGVEREAYRDLRKILTHIRSQVLEPEAGQTLSQTARKMFSRGDDMFYGLSDIDELFTETLTNTRFSVWMSTQAPLPDIKLKNTNIFKNLYEQVKQLFKNLIGGQNIRPDSLLSQAMDNILALAQDPQDDAKIDAYRQADKLTIRRRLAAALGVDDVDDLDLPEGPGWLSGSNEFVPADESSSVRVQGLGIGGHEKAALNWLEKNRPQTYQKLYEDSEGDPTSLDYGVIVSAMEKHGFLRITGDSSTLYFTGKPTAKQISYLKDVGMLLDTQVVHDLGSRSRTIYDPSMGSSASSTPASKVAAVDKMVQNAIGSMRTPVRSANLNGHPAQARMSESGELEIVYDPEAIAIETEGLNDEEAASTISKLLGHENIHIAGIINDYSTPDSKGRVGREKIEAFHDEVMTDEMRQETADAYVRRFDGMTDAEYQEIRDNFLSDKVAVAGEYKRMFTERYLTGESYEDALKALENKTGDRFSDIVRSIADYLMGRIRMLVSRYQLTKDPRLAAVILNDSKMLQRLSSATGTLGDNVTEINSEILNASKVDSNKLHDIRLDIKGTKPHISGERAGLWYPKIVNGEITNIDSIPNDPSLRFVHNEGMLGSDVYTASEFKDFLYSRKDSLRFFNRNSYSVYKTGDAVPQNLAEEIGIDPLNASKAQIRRMKKNSAGWKASGWFGQGLMDKQAWNRVEQQNAEMRGANYRVQETARQFDKLVKKHKPDPATLQAALGNTDNVLTDAQYKNWKKMVKAAKSETDPTKRQAAIAASDSYRISQIQVNNAQKKADRLAALSLLPQDLRDVVDTMRKHVDQLSKTMISEGIVGKNLQATLGANMEVYLNRSYEVFDNPEWSNFIMTDKSADSQRIRNNAATMFRSQLVAEEARKIRRNARLNNQAVPTRQQALAAAQATVTSTDVTNLMEDYLRIGDGSAADMFLGGRVPGKKDTSIITLRGQIPKELRELMGEYKDAGVNYAKSYLKMSSFIANHNFQKDFLDMGLTRSTPFLWKEGVSPGRRPLGWEKVYSNLSDSPNPNPMADVYGPPIVAEAFRELNKTHEQLPVMKFVTGLTGIAMASKTIYNPPQTYVRNFAGNGLLMLAQGYLTNDISKLGFFKRFGTSTYTTGEKLFGVQADRSNQVVDYIEKLTSLGVMGDNVKATIIKDLTSVIFDRDPKNAFNEKLSSIMSLAKKGNDRLIDAYQAGDDFWKILAFESERSTFEKAYPKATPEALDRMAADRVRAVLPTYSVIPKFVKDIVKGQPYLAPYISWTSEIIRTSLNTFKFGYEDVVSGNPALQKSGLVRLGSMLVAQGLLVSAASVIRSFAQMDDDDEEALRRFLPEWQVNALIALTGKTADGKVSFWDLSYLNPFDVVQEPFTAMTNEYKQGGSSWDVAAAGLDKAMAPWTGEQLFFGAVADVARGYTKEGYPLYEKSDTDWNNFKKGADRIWSAVKPGGINFVERIAKAYNGEVSPSGKVYNIEDELKGAILGQKPGEVDLLQVFQNKKLGAFNRMLESSTNLATKEYRTRGTADINKIKEDYRQSNDSRMKAFVEVRKDVDALVRMGIPKHKVYGAMEARGVSKDDINQIANGKYVRRFPGDSALENAVGSPNFGSRIQALRDARDSYPSVQSLTSE